MQKLLFLVLLFVSFVYAQNCGRFNCNNSQICCRTAQSSSCCNKTGSCCGSSCCPQNTRCCFSARFPLCCQAGTTCCGSTCCPQGYRCQNQERCVRAEEEVVSK